MQGYDPGCFVRAHEAAADRLAAALDLIDEMRADRRYLDMLLGSVTRENLTDLQGELLDYVAAHVGPDPNLTVPVAREALLTAAECAVGSLALGCFPEGDWDVSLPLFNKTLSSDEKLYCEQEDPVQAAATAATWIDAFRLSLVSGLIWDRSKVLGPMLRDDYAPTIHKGVPYSRWETASSPADLAEMDALAAYLYVVRTEHSPWVDQGPVPVRMPDAEARERAAAQLDAAGELNPDQRLLRVLLDGNQPAFEHALVARLLAYRNAMDAEPAPVVRTLLPVGVLALAVLAVLAHGWDLGLTSDYLPIGLLRAPEQAPTS